jgi:hypothetical protein
MVEELEKIIDGSLGNVIFYGGWYNFVAHFLFEFFDLKKVYSVDWNEDVVDPSKRLYLDEVNAGRFMPFSMDVNELEWKEEGGVWYMDWDKRQESIDAWMQKQNEACDAKRQEIIDDWMSKDSNIAKVKQGVVDKEALFDEIAGDDLRASYFENKEEVFENYGWRKIDDINLVINTSCEHMDNTWFDKIPEGQLVLLQTNDYFENEQHSNCCKDLEDAKKKYPMQEVLYEGELDTQLYNRFMLIGYK